MYVSPNFKTKKELKEAVKNWVDYWKNESNGVHQVLNTGKPKPKPVTIFQPGPFGGNEPTDGTVHGIEGPHYPKPHRWYASVELKEGVVVKVK